MKHKVRMLKTVPGSYDGITPMTWHRGHVYDDIHDLLLANFIALGAVELVEDAPENAAVAAAPERKRRRRDAL
jgi:hypothetical protein